METTETNVKYSKDEMRVLENTDYRDSLKTKFNRPQLIIADPPYNLGLAAWDVDFDYDELMFVLSKILDRNGSALVFNRWENMLPLDQFARHHGLKVHQLLVWVKPNTPVSLIRTKGYVTKNREFILWVSRTDHVFFQLKPDEKYHTGVFTYPRVPNKPGRFPFEKPKALINDLILRHSQPNDLVMDLFAGSGVVARCCKQWHRRYYGYEIDFGTYQNIDLE